MKVKTIKANLRNLVLRRPLNLVSNILITEFCNQNCLHCNITNGKTPENKMDLEKFRLVLDRLSEYGTQFVNITGGEPLLHPQILDILSYCIRSNISNIQILTNLYHSPEKIYKVGRYLLENHIHIQTSFDGLGETADYLRGSKNTTRVVARNMEILRQMKKKFKSKSRLSVNIAMNEVNYRQIPRIIDLCSDLGWYINIDVYRCHNPNNRYQRDLFLQESESLWKIIRLLKKSKNISTLPSFIRGIPDYVNGEYRKRCPYLDAPIMGAKSYLTPDGSVFLCLGDSVGNLFHQELGDIFDGHRYQQRIKEFRSCNGCWINCYVTNAIIFNPKSVREFLETLLWVMSII